MKKLDLHLNKIKVTIIIIIALFVIIIAKKTLFKGNKEKTKIAYTTPVYKNIIQAISAIGTVEPIETPKIYVSVPLLKVEKVFVKVGDVVKKGQVIITYDKNSKKDAERTLKKDILTLKILQKQLKIDKKATKSLKMGYENELYTYNSKLKVYKVKGISKTNLNQAKQDMLTAKQIYDTNLSTISDDNDKIAQQKFQIQTDKNEVEKNITETRSPVNGVVLKLTAEPNYFVSMQNPNALCSLADLSHLIIVAKVPADDIQTVKKGQKVIISANNLKTPINGKVYKISSTANSQKSSNSTQIVYVDVKIKFKNPKDILKPNYNVNVRIITASKKHAMCIPKFSIFPDDNNKYYVYTMDRRHIVHKKYITVGISSDLDTQILSGFDLKTKIITTVNNDIKNGLKIDKKLLIKESNDDSNQGEK